MNVKIHHFSIRLCVLSRTTVQQKCDVAFLHSWFYTLGGFANTQTIVILLLSLLTYSIDVVEHSISNTYV